MDQKPGQKPETSPAPGMETLASRRPPVKHSLFQLCTMPER
jgi:hypothetical protein